MGKEKVILMADYQEQQARKRVQNVLDTLYIGILDAMANEALEIHPQDMEDFLIQAATDYLTLEFSVTYDLDVAAEHYIEFENRLRDAVCHRLAHYLRLS